MTRILLFIFPLFCLVYNYSSAQKSDILFIGNSYTGSNNLPNILKELSLSLGDSIDYDVNTPGGYTLESHSTNATTLSKIQSKNWDFVVLQEQSQRPSFSPSQVAMEVYPYATILVDSIKANNNCSEPVFYMTWGRKNGDAANCPVYPPICTYAGMQDRLTDSYSEMALDNNSTLSPVGEVWRYCRDNYPYIELYTSDESHPSIEGSYLAACTFYATLFQKNLATAWHPTSIVDSIATHIQSCAENVVLGNNYSELATWLGTGNILFTEFTYSEIDFTSSSITYSFSNSSLNTASSMWYFGDGGTSALESPTHEYFTSGNQTTSLITNSLNGCSTDSIAKIIEVPDWNGIITLEKQIEFNLFPNPTKNLTSVQIGKNYRPDNLHVSIHSLSGDTILEKRFTQLKKKNLIDVSTLPSGTYLLKVTTIDGSHTKKLIIVE